MQGNPASMPSHHFDDNRTFVTCRGGMQTIERVHYRCHGGIETEGHGRSFQIVVDGFWNTHAIDPRFL